MDLKDYRQQIDKIDDELLQLFKERMAVSHQVALYKKEHGLQTLDASRESEKLAEIGEKAGSELRPYAHTLYATILELSRLYQRSVLDL